MVHQKDTATENMAQEEIASMAHLMRRAGFGDSRRDLEVRVGPGYEEVVEELRVE